MSQQYVYEPFFSSNFKNCIKKLKKQNLDIGEVFTVIALLAKDIPMPPEYRDHKLTNFKPKGSKITGDFRECHLQGKNSDWVLVYQKRKANMVLYLYSSGSHSNVLE